VEVEMVGAANLLLSSSSVIFVCKIFRLASVELNSRNSNKGNIAIFPLSQGIYPTSHRMHPKQMKVSIDMKTVVLYFILYLPL
jgi:hypothetical protein